MAEAPLATLALGGIEPALAGSHSVRLKDGTRRRMSSRCSSC